MKRNLMLILAAIAAVVIGSCSWEIPEEVVFRAQPQLWIPTGGAVFELDFVDEIIDEFTQSVSDLDLEAGEKGGGRIRRQAADSVRGAGDRSSKLPRPPARPSV